MNGYELSRHWFNFSFENPERVRPIHAAIFFFACEHCNRLGGKDKFGFPSQMTMDAIGVKNYQTYGKALKDLEDWGFITFIERSKNQYSANIISINAPTKNDKARGKALDKATLKHTAKQTQSTPQGIVSIDKPSNQVTKEPSNQGVEPPRHFLVEWLNENAPRVQQLKEPITNEQAERICNDFELDFAKQVFTSMHNYKKLTSNVISANLTFRKWAAKDKQDETDSRSERQKREDEQLKRLREIHGPDFLREFGTDASRV